MGEWKIENHPSTLFDKNPLVYLNLIGIQFHIFAIAFVLNVVVVVAAVVAVGHCTAVAIELPGVVLSNRQGC